MDALKDSGEFKQLDVMIASSLWTIVKGEWVSNLRRKNEKLIEQNDMLNGRQIYWYLCTELRRSPYIDSMEATAHFMSLLMRNDNLQGYLNAWRKSFENLAIKPSDDIIEWKFYTEIAKSEQFRPTFERHEWAINHENGKRDFETLWKMVETHIHQEKKKRNDNQEKGPTVWGLAAQADNKKGKGKGKEKGGKGKESASELTCPTGGCRTYFWKGTCPKLATGNCEFKHDVTKFPAGKGTKEGKGKKGKGKGKEKGEGKKDSKAGGRTRSATPKPAKSPSRGTSPSGDADRMPCSSYSKDGICKRPNQSVPCKFWHPPVCPFERKGPGKCRDGDKCSLLHFEKPSYEQKKAAVAALPAAKAKGKAKEKAKAKPKPKAKGAMVAVRVMLPDYRTQPTCICRDGIEDDLDTRHCINRCMPHSLYCAMCSPDECRCGCGPCEGSPEPSSDPSDPGYHDPDRTEPWNIDSESSTSEGPQPPPSSPEEEWPPVPERHDSHSLRNQFGSRSRLVMRGCNESCKDCTMSDDLAALEPLSPLN